MQLIHRRVCGLAPFVPPLVFLAAPAFPAGSQSSVPARATPDVQALGPQVGQPVPDFSLPDQQGRVQTLSSLKGPQGLVLVFNRSADW